jgi:hypothetical protein
MSRRILLIRFPGQPGGERLAVPSALELAVRRAGLDPRDLAVHAALDSAQCYGYLYPAPDRRGIDDAAWQQLRGALAEAMPAATAMRLLALMEIEGASAAADPTHHYVVETDVVEAADPELNAWYDQEHLPGLAAVPGTVRAARYRNLDDGPRYHACYELATLETFGSPAWLQVRASAWSSRVRPHFINTRRTMFRSLQRGEGC